MTTDKKVVINNNFEDPYFNLKTVPHRPLMNSYNVLIGFNKIYDIVIFKADPKLKNSEKFIKEVISFEL